MFADRSPLEVIAICILVVAIAVPTVLIVFGLSILMTVPLVVFSLAVAVYTLCCGDRNILDNEGIETFGEGIETLDESSRLTVHEAV